jgi:hypothetical protein
MSDNYSNKIYFLETDKTHTIEQFKIVKYCSIENLDFKQTDNKRDFPKKGELVIKIKNVYDINDMQSLIKNEFTVFTPSSDKKLYIVHENDDQQYLYYTKDYNYKISDKKIQIKNCFQTKFDKLTTKDANTDFIQRVKYIQDNLEKLAKHIDNTRESLSKAQKTQYQKGGAESIDFTDLNLGKNKGENNPQEIEGRFNTMIRSYIDNVNEIANYSFFKKLFSLSEDDINDKSIDNKDKFGFSDSIKQRIYEFKYVCVNYQSIPDDENKSYDELSDKLKFLLLGLDFEQGIRNIGQAIENYDKSKKDYLIEGDQIDENSFPTQAKFLKEKYNDYDTSVKYKVGHFANNILEPIYKSKLNLSNINQNDDDFKNDIARFLFFILGIIEYEYKYLRQLFYTSFEGEENTNSQLIEKFNDETMHKKLDNRIQTNINNSILTYLKIRNDYHQEGSGETDLSEQSYNRRFEIKFPKYSEGDNKQILLLNYNNDNETYYEKDQRNMYLPIKHEKEEQKTDIEKIEKGSIDSINYPYSYLFGKYNNIFEPKQDNSTVANQITEVIDAMNKNKTVFVIGYGASGAGKTSTLISRRMPNGDIQDGILIELCKRYCESMSDKTITVNVHSCEIYQDANQENQEPTINYTGNWNKDNSKQPVNFDYNNSSFKLSSSIQHENFHPFRVNKQSDNECNFNGPKEFAKDTQLSDYLRYIIDTDRHVKATPNNINSSRSHALVFIGFTISNNGHVDNNTPVLIIGDFAGVENEFNCADLNAKNDFLSIVGENNKLFYENEKCNDVIDPIGNKFDKKEGGQNSNKENINKIKKALNGLPFNYGAIDEDFKKINDLINNTEPIELKKAIRFLRKAVNIDYQDNKEPLQLEDIKPITPDLINTLKSNWETVKTNINNGLQALQENKEKNEAEENKKEVRDMLLHFFEKEYELHSSATLYRNDLYANVFSKDTSSVLYVATKKMTNQSLNIKGVDDNYTTNSESQIKENMFMFLEKAFLEYLKQNTDFKNKFEKVCKEYAPDGIAEITLSDELPNKLPEKEPLFKTLYLTSRLYLHNKEKNNISLSETTYADFFVSYIFKILYNNKDEDLYKAYNRFIIKPTKQKPLITILRATTDKNGKVTLLTLEFLDYYNKIWEETKSIQLNTGSKTQEGVIFNEENPLQPILNQTVDNSKIFSFKNIKDIQENEPKYTEEKNFIDSLFVNKLEFVKDLEIYTYEQQQLANSVCTNRVTEGKFINNSLADMRNMIRYVLQQKNKNMLDIVPNYINICLDKYCPNHKNCFSFETNEKDSEEQPVSIIFKQIELYFTNYARTKYKSNKEFNSEELYNDLILSVFCVLNISKNANDPPKVPYIDINELKRIVYNYDIFMSEKDTIRGESAKKKKQMIKTNRTLLYSYASYLLNQIDSHYIQKIKTTEGEEPTETNVLEFIKTIDTKVSLNPETTRNSLLDYLTEKPVQSMKLYDAFVFIINHLFPNKKPLYYDLHLKKQIEDKKVELSNKRKTINENINKTYELKLQIDEAKERQKLEKEEAKNLLNTLKNLEDKGKSVQEFTSYYYDIEYLNHFLNLELKRLEAAEAALQNPVYNHPGYNAKDFYDNILIDYDRSNILDNDKDFEDLLIVFIEKDVSSFEKERAYVYVTLKSYIHDTLNQINIDRVTTELRSLASREIQLQNKISPVCDYLFLINRYLKSDKSYTRFDAFNASKMSELKTTIKYLEVLVNIWIKELNEKIKEIKKDLEKEFKALEAEYEDYILEDIKIDDSGSVGSDSSENSTTQLQQDIKGFNKQSLKLQEEVIELKKEIEEKEKLLYFDIPTNEGNKDKTVYPSTETIKKNQSQINNYPKHYMNILKLFLDEIDKYNAASAVGTLEFLDQISKLNTVSTICNFNENDMDTDEFAKKLHSDEIISLYKSNEIN